MANLTSQLIVRILDAASRPARVIANAIRGIGQAARGVGSTFGAFNTGLAATQARLAVAMNLNRARMQSARMGMVDAIAGYYILKRTIAPAIEQARAFEEAMEGIGQKTAMSTAGLRAYGQRLREVAQQVHQDETNIAAGINTLIRMGASPDLALKLATPAGRFATAYKVAFDDAGQAGYRALANLHIAADQSGRVFDVMAAGAKRGTVDVKTMASAFPGLTAAAHNLGMKGVPAVADLVAALEVASKGAGSPEEAASNLNNFLTRLMAPQTLKKFKKAGVDIRKEVERATSGDLAKRGVSPIEHLLGVVMEVTKGGRADLLTNLFGGRFGLKFLRPLLDNIETLQKIRAEALAAQGVVDKDYAKRLETFGQKAEDFHNAIQDLQISLGLALLPGLSKLVDAVKPLIHLVADLAERFPVLTSGVVGLAAGFLAIGIALAGIRYAFALAFGGFLRFTMGLIKGIKFAAAFGGWLIKLPRLLLALVVPAETLAPIFVALSASMAPLLIAILAIAAAGYFIYKNWSGIQAMFAEIGAQFSETWDGMKQRLKPALDAIRPALRSIGQALDSINIRLSDDTWKAFGQVAGIALKSVAGAIVLVVGGIAGLIEIIRKAADWFDRMAEHAKKAWQWLNPPATGANRARWGGYLSRPLPSDANPPGRALGGPVQAGHPYQVLEKRRAEIFVPRENGRVIPADALKGGRDINFAPQFTFHIQGNANPADIASMVRRVLKTEIHQLFRGLQADTGLLIG